jgi:hypothetical protein
MALPGEIRLWVQGGPTTRGEPNKAGLGLSGTLVASKALTARAGVAIRVDARGWAGNKLVPSILDADIYGSWAPAPHWSIWGDVGWSRIGGNEETETWAGLPGGGGHQVRALGTLSRSLGRLMGATVEIRADKQLQASSGFRLRAVLGVTGHFGRVRGPAPTLHDPAAVWFEIEVPDASEVLLVASFNGWQPITLAKTGPNRWSVELAVPPGEHEYLFLVDGETYVPPDAPLLRPDGFGGANAVLQVGPPVQ